jgi:D-glycero-D-manno-heptose 1,7-bisphosphate phosphatase
MTRNTSSRAAIFIDKDGTLLDDVPYNVDPSLMHLAPGAFDALASFSKLEDVQLFIISNQSGIALGKFSFDALHAVEARLHSMAADAGASFEAMYWCPHQASDECECRKPAPGMLLQAAHEHDLDLSRSWFIGDILNDIEAAHRAGCRAVLIDNGNETEWLRGPMREPDLIVKDMHEAARAIAPFFAMDHAP